MEHNLYMFSMGSKDFPVENHLLRYMTMFGQHIVMGCSTHRCMNDGLLYISTNKSWWLDGISSSYA